MHHRHRIDNFETLFFAVFVESTIFQTGDISVMAFAPSYANMISERKRRIRLLV